jgi:molecular chaperone GrpE
MKKKQKLNKEADNNVESSKDTMTEEQDSKTLEQHEVHEGEFNAEATHTELDLVQRIADLESQLAAEKENFLRKYAEMENYKKRLETQKLQAYESARVDSLTRFLPIYDDLQRSLEAASKLESVDKTFLEGIKMVSGKFSDVLGQYGLQRIDEIMVPFNYELHEALMRQKHDDPAVQPNTVIMMLEPGYKMGDRVIRHAKVMVSE